jgi:NAD(P)H-dependent FMN reductase
VSIFDGLGELPFYNDDIDGPDVVAAVVDLRTAAAEADAVLVVTPEFNGSIPAVVKNAIDWLSRPFGDGAVKGKPLAVIGASMGQYGGLWGHDETRKSFAIAGAKVVEAVTLSLPAKSLGGRHPRESAELVAAVEDALQKLYAEVA